VLTVCLATRNGGPYLDVQEDMIRNIDTGQDYNADGEPDGDFDANLDGFPGQDIRAATNYVFGGSAIFELIDYWGNPLVYIQNRDYLDFDGWNDNTTPADPSDDYWEDPLAEPNPEYMLYADAEGNLMRLYARDGTGLATQNFPKLNGFQLFSIGADGVENLSYSYADDLYYVIPPWRERRVDSSNERTWQFPQNFLTNWEE
jgi:hypothetical protein